MFLVAEHLEFMCQALRPAPAAIMHNLLLYMFRRIRFHFQDFSTCEHNRQRSVRNLCSGSSICELNRSRTGGFIW
jgi:hypothetical protein